MKPGLLPAKRANIASTKPTTDRTTGKPIMKRIVSYGKAFRT